MGSTHDFSNWLTIDKGKEICVVCHTPHNAKTEVEAPLWNHQASMASYNLYSSKTIDASIGVPSASSKACLSCHDGTVAIYNFGTNTNGKYFMPGKRNLGTNLSDDHPISIVYDSALAAKDGELFDPSTKTVAALGSETIAKGMLIDGKLECASCHDVHAVKGESGVPGRGQIRGKLLLVQGNGLCFTCHNK